MKKIIFSLSMLFCLFFANIEAKSISVDRSEIEATKENNQIDLMGNLTNMGTRTLIKPIVLMQSWDKLEASFVEKLGSITIEILDESNNPIYKHLLDTNTQNHFEIRVPGIKGNKYTILFINSDGNYLKGKFEL